MSCQAVKAYEIYILNLSLIKTAIFYLYLHTEAVKYTIGYQVKMCFDSLLLFYVFVFFLCSYHIIF